MIDVKSPREIELMIEAGKVVAKVFEAMKKAIRPGISTKELDDIADEVIRSNGAISGSKGYEGYPGSICISVNDTLIHGIPSNKIILKEGDIVSTDVVVKKSGYYADATRTFPVGVINERAKNIIEVTRNAFFEAYKIIKPGIRVGDISHSIEDFVRKSGYSLTELYTGHGIGREMHEDPSIPNVGKGGTGPILKEGMAIAIEPMVLEGKKDTRVLGDGWTVKSKDGKLTCHYENTVIITSEGAKIITLMEEEK